MANETIRSKSGDNLANLIQPGGDGNALAATLREASKMVILTAAAYTALAVKDPNTLYITVG